MREVRERPPMYAEICDKFPVHGKPVLFAWGDKIYNPYEAIVSPFLQAHENVHGKRQLAGMTKSDDPNNDAEFAIIRWWENYLADPVFRLDEEVLALAVEYSTYAKAFHGRNERFKYMYGLATRLALPIYQLNITAMAALDLLKQKSENIRRDPALLDFLTLPAKEMKKAQEALDPLGAALMEAHPERYTGDEGGLQSLIQRD